LPVRQLRLGQKEDVPLELRDGVVQFRSRLADHQTVHEPAVRALELDSEPPCGRARLERLQKHEPCPRDAHVELLLAVGPDLEQGRIPFRVAGDEPHGVLVVRQSHDERIVIRAFDEGAREIRRRAIRAVGPGRVFVLRRRLGASAVRQTLDGLKAEPSQG
jgi:hypothetical protein